MSDINMARVNRRTAIKKVECKFVSDLIGKVKNIIQDSCPCKPASANGKTVSNTLEYDTIAAESEVVTLTMLGFVMYLYEKAYNDPYPSGALTPVEKYRIYEIYDALKIPRPVL
jgi:hypothetical protein